METRLACGHLSAQVGHFEGKQEIRLFMCNIERPDRQAKRVYSHEVGKYLYDISKPKFVGPGSLVRDYNEREYFYYLGEPGKSFVLTRNKIQSS